MRTYPARVLLCALILLLFGYGSPASADPDTRADRAESQHRFEVRGALEFSQAVADFAQAYNNRLRCPVPGSTFIASFGAPRTGHLHQGTDMMAPDGTPIYAPQAGTYRQHGSDSFYLDAVNGDQWFGTHLQSHVHADGPVNAGDLIALVGHSGNASATGPHLHIELHPGGGPAIEAYPVLAAACSSAPTAPVESEAPAEASPSRGPEPARPTFIYQTAEVHRYWNWVHFDDRIRRPEAIRLRRYFNAVTWAKVAAYVRAVSAIPYEANWDRVAQCESGGDWFINTGNGYYGGVQFSLATWHSVGGSGYPHQNSKAEQIRRAEILRQRSGLGQWPVCGSRWYG